jgi:hypothetical protein
LFVAVSYAEEDTVDEAHEFIWATEEVEMWSWGLDARYECCEGVDAALR